MAAKKTTKATARKGRITKKADAPRMGRGAKKVTTAKRGGRAKKA